MVEPNADPAALDRHTFDMRRAEYRHEGDKSTFQVMVARHGLESERRRPESARLDAFIRGLQLSVPDDHQKLLLVRPLYDALYAYCQAKVQALRPYQGAPRLRLWYSQRVATHIEDDHE